MIRPLTTPVEAIYRTPTERTPGRYEGLVHFAHKLSGLFGSVLRGWTVLDVGGADGWLGELLVCRNYWWVDPRAEWVNLTFLPGFPKLRYYSALIGHAEGLPFQTGAVDLVVSKQTLPHFLDPAQACREMCRVARHAVVIRQDWGYTDTQGQHLPIGWPGHSRSQIDHPDDILGVLRNASGLASYDGDDFVAWRA
jgi:SAM-dependent methyltransferase